MSEPTIIQEELLASGEVILFADDEESVRKMAGILLERLRYSYVMVRDGVEAVESFRMNHSKVAAVVLDLTMPKLTGRDCLRKLREIDPNAKIVATSGYTLDGTVEDLIRDGADVFIRKPYTIEDLARALKRVLVG